MIHTSKSSLRYNSQPRFGRDNQAIIQSFIHRPIKERNFDYIAKSGSFSKQIQKACPPTGSLWHYLKTQSSDLRHILGKQSDVMDRLPQRFFQRSHGLQISGLSSQESSRAALELQALILSQRNVYFMAYIRQISHARNVLG